MIPNLDMNSINEKQVSEPSKGSIYFQVDKYESTAVLTMQDLFFPEIHIT